MKTPAALNALSEIDIPDVGRVTATLDKADHQKLKQLAHETNIRQTALASKLLSWALRNYDRDKPTPPKFTAPEVLPATASLVEDVARHVMASQFIDKERGKLETGSVRARFVAVLFIINMIDRKGERATSDKIAMELDAHKPSIQKLVQTLAERGVLVRTQVTNSQGFGRMFWLQIAPNAVQALNKSHRAETGKPIFPVSAAKATN